MLGDASAVSPDGHVSITDLVDRTGIDQGRLAFVAHVLLTRAFAVVPLTTPMGVRGYFIADCYWTENEAERYRERIDEYKETAKAWDRIAASLKAFEANHSEDLDPRTVD
ncbi:MAG: hypothetical protein V3T70_05710 [Phycisphaerae bacterium]